MRYQRTHPIITRPPASRPSAPLRSATTMERGQLMVPRRAQGVGRGERDGGGSLASGRAMRRLGWPCRPGRRSPAHEVAASGILWRMEVADPHPSWGGTPRRAHMHEIGTLRKHPAALAAAGGALIVRCTALALTLLLASCASPPEVSSPVVQPAAPVAQPEVLTPATILRVTADTYANCKTYRDSGRATSKMVSGTGGPVLIAPFQTAYERPDQFRFGTESMMLGWIVWRHGPAVRTWSRHDGYERPESLHSALAALAGVSGTSSITVPTLLVAEAGADSVLTATTDVLRLEDAELGDSHCYCLRGHQGPVTVTFWIDQTSHLLLRVVRDIDANGDKVEVTITYDPVIDEALPADALAFGSPEG